MFTRKEDRIRQAVNHSIVGFAVLRLLFHGCLLPIASVGMGAEVFPGRTWETATPAEQGWNEEKLSAVLDFAMLRKSSSVVLVDRGVIIAERHVQVDSPSRRYESSKIAQNQLGHAIEDVASVQKSIVSYLIGIAVKNGKIGLDAPVQQYLGTGWSRCTASEEKQITLQHLLTMTSGLNVRLQRTAQPGTQWHYNTAAYSKTIACLEAALDQEIQEISRQWLFDPIGMHDSSWTSRGNGIGVGQQRNPWGLTTSARDLARFGLLISRGGRWEDQEQRIDPGYLGAALKPSQTLNESYGFLWWLNGQRGSIRAGRHINRPLLPTAPDDLVAGLGAMGRKCYVVPSRDWVVVRLGDDPNLPGKKQFDLEFWQRLMLAAPDRAK